MLTLTFIIGLVLIVAAFRNLIVDDTTDDINELQANHDWMLHVGCMMSVVSVILLLVL